VEFNRQTVDLQGLLERFLCRRTGRERGADHEGYGPRLSVIAANCCGVWRRISDGDVAH